MAFQTPSGSAGGRFFILLGRSDLVQQSLVKQLNRYLIDGAFSSRAKCMLTK
jgi:hypothetical protein